MDSSPPSGDPQHLEIDISRMDEDERDAFLLFMDGSDIEFEVHGYLLFISPADEERTRQILAAASGDALVDFDVDDLDGIDPDVTGDDPDSEWSKTIAAMLHPSGRCEVVPSVGAAWRFIASFVSFVIWYVIMLLVAGVMIYMDLRVSDFWVLALFLLPVVGEVAAAAEFSTTPGMYVLGLRVVDTSGERPGWLRSALRTLAVTWPYVLMLVGGPLAGWAMPLGAVWVAALVFLISNDPRHLGVQDRVSGTQVVPSRRRSVPRPLVD